VARFAARRVGGGPARERACGGFCGDNSPPVRGRRKRRALPAEPRGQVPAGDLAGMRAGGVLFTALHGPAARKPGSSP
jgi:hypothetical protein